jgi:hypothetical protein
MEHIDVPEPTKEQYAAMPPRARARAKKIWADKKKNQAILEAAKKEKAAKPKRIDAREPAPKVKPKATPKPKAQPKTLREKIEARRKRQEQASQ